MYNTGIYQPGGTGGGASGTGYSGIVATYDDLPDVVTASGQFWFVKDPQGTAWLPWTLGGTYHPSGTYYSDGITWITGVSPSQATLVTVNAGIVTDQFVSPYTLTNATVIVNKELLANKSTSVVTDQASDTKYPSVKSVYDWGVATFQGIGLALLKANNLSDLASKKTARVNLGVDVRTAIGDANYQILLTDKEVVTSVAFTGPRTFTLPLANTMNPGQELIVSDELGTVTSVNTLTILCAGSDTMNGVTSEAIMSAYGMRRIFSDGVSKYTFDKGVLRASKNLSDLVNAPAAVTNLGLSSAASLNTGSGGVGFYGNGGVITINNFAEVIMTCAGTIDSWIVSSIDPTTGSAVVGSIVIDIKRNGTSIIGSGNKPTLTSQSANSAVANGSWTAKTFAVGDKLAFYVVSATTVLQVESVILYTKA